MISQLLGGIGLFLLGVFLMTDGLKTAAGGALQRIMANLADRPITAFISGAGITALAQSSSATTLATIGFVSASILNFSQAVGIVIGATLGTTTTGWIVALVGLKVGIGKLAFPIVGVAAVARLVSHGRNAAIALAVAGFGLIFAGIDILQAGMMGLTQSFSPASLPHGTFLGRMLLVGIGIVLTMITQSSASAVATTLTAFHAGMIGLEQGASLIIGASVGTTSTSALAAIGATTAAKRTAMAHILFSVVAGVLAFLLTPLFVSGVQTAQQVLRIQFGAIILAAFHSGFTLLAALLILPCVKQFSGFVVRLIPERGPGLTRHLDASVVEVPQVAMEAMRRTLMDVATELLTEIERGLQGSLAPKPDRVGAAEAALRETRRFLGTVAFPESPPDQPNRRIAIIHALDHLRELQIALRDKFNPGQLQAERLRHYKSMTLELVETALAALRRSQPVWRLDRLREISAAMAENRRTERATLLGESARGAMDPEQALHTLDGLRWLDTVGYHTWRALYHLSTPASEVDDGGAPYDHCEPMVD